MSVLTLTEIQALARGPHFLAYVTCRPWRAQMTRSKNSTPRTRRPTWYGQAMEHCSSELSKLEIKSSILAAAPALCGPSNLIADFLSTRGFDAAVLDAGLCFMLDRRTKQTGAIWIVAA